MNYHFRIHKEAEGGYWAECVELQGCLTQGDSMQELRDNAAEALELHLSEPEDSKICFPLPHKLEGRNILVVPVPPGIAFAVLLRHYRLKRNLTQRKTADALGIKNISAYQRLENATAANPELLTIAKIKTFFPEFRVEILF